MMAFEQFLEQCLEQTWWHKPSIVFVGNTFTPLFFTDFFTTLEGRACLPFPRTTLPRNADLMTIAAQLQQSILGQSSVIWCGDVAEQFGTARLAKMLPLLASYQGPHVAVWYLDDAAYDGLVQKPAMAIALPTTISMVAFVRLASLLHPELEKRIIDWYGQQFVAKQKCGLDTACMLLRYLTTLPSVLACTQKALEAVQLACMQQQPTLRQLADRFFAKDQSAFFALWSELSTQYQTVFWTVFWAEQLWNAYHALYQLQRRDFTKAKRASARLPYAFLEHYAQRLSLEQLRRQYRLVYQLDLFAKRGSQACLLEHLFIDQFF